MKVIFNRDSLTLFWLSLAVSAFIGTACSETGTRVTPSGATLTSSGFIPDLIRARRERDRGPRTESEWNRYRTWKKIKTQPPTFIPANYPKNSARTNEDGQWFVDHRVEADGKRLFVPNYMVGPMSASVLAVEAAAIVDWQHSKGKSWYHKVDHRQ
ncbi:MAG: hypothetical protein ACJAQT_005022 [Akkermansiaceae bacterium]|jgi:hypothetical protein